MIDVTEQQAIAGPLTPEEIDALREGINTELLAQGKPLLPRKD